MKIYAHLTACMIAIAALAGPTSASAQHPGVSNRGEPNLHHVQARDNKQRVLKGHRGVREQRKGYRRHSDGYWYPAAAFAKSTEKRSTQDRRAPAERERR